MLIHLLDYLMSSTSWSASSWKLCKSWTFSWRLRSFFFWYHQKLPRKCKSMTDCGSRWIWVTSVIKNQDETWPWTSSSNANQEEMHLLAPRFFFNIIRIGYSHLSSCPLARPGIGDTNNLQKNNQIENDSSSSNEAYLLLHYIISIYLVIISINASPKMNESNWRKRKIMIILFDWRYTKLTSRGACNVHVVFDEFVCLIVCICVKIEIVVQNSWWRWKLNSYTYMHDRK